LLEDALEVKRVGVAEAIRDGLHWQGSISEEFAGSFHGGLQQPAFKAHAGVALEALGQGGWAKALALGESGDVQGVAGVTQNVRDEFAVALAADSGSSAFGLEVGGCSEQQGLPKTALAVPVVSVGGAQQRGEGAQVTAFGLAYRGKNILSEGV